MPCPKLYRDDKIHSVVPSDCKSVPLQTSDLSSQGLDIAQPAFVYVAEYFIYALQPPFV